MDITTIITQSKTGSGQWCALITIGDITIEADIRPDSRRRLEAKYEVAVDPAGTGETYETLQFGNDADRQEALPA